MGKKKPSGMRPRSLAQLLREWMSKGAALDIGGGCEALGFVRDVSLAYGRTRLLFQPAAGSGVVWVGAERVRKAESLPVTETVP